MDELVKLARRNPWVLVGLAGLGGWILGAGALPGLPSWLGPSSPAPAATPASSGGPVSGAPDRSASVASSSASMPAAEAVDPFAGYGI
jgi:hypothetical protein